MVLETHKLDYFTLCISEFNCPFCVKNRFFLSFLNTFVVAYGAFSFKLKIQKADMNLLHFPTNYDISA